MNKDFQVGPPPPPPKTPLPQTYFKFYEPLNKLNLLGLWSFKALMMVEEFHTTSTIAPFNMLP
jgi:hypothetical protein